MFKLILSATILLAACVLPFCRTFVSMHEFIQFNLKFAAIPEPEGLRTAAQQMRRRELSAEERVALERDGVIIIRDLIQDKKLLKMVAESSRLFNDSVIPPNLRLPRAWYWHGAIRALLEEGPFRTLFKSATDLPGLELRHAEFWNVLVKADGIIRDDDQLSKLTIPVMHPDSDLNLWTAFADAAHPVVFLKGSHRRNDTDILAAGCSTWDGPHNKPDYHTKCMFKYATEKFTPQIGHESIWVARNINAGDAILFKTALHGTIVARDARASLCMRVDTHDLQSLGSNFLVPNGKMAFEQWWAAHHTAQPFYPLHKRASLDSLPFLMFPWLGPYSPTWPGWLGTYQQPTWKAYVFGYLTLAGSYLGGIRLNEAAEQRMRDNEYWTTHMEEDAFTYKSFVHNIEK